MRPQGECRSTSFNVLEPGWFTVQLKHLDLVYGVCFGCYQSNIMELSDRCSTDHSLHLSRRPYGHVNGEFLLAKIQIFQD